MEKQIELPQRADNHIRETSGYKILESKIPSEWIIRYVTERDYGVDCYIELINTDNRLTGEIAFVQVKSTDKINWSVSDNGFKFYKVDRSTTNYLCGFKIPTYLFLIELSTKEMFFLSVKEYISKHYRDFLTSGTFAYDFSHENDLFSIDAFLKSFRKNNLYDQYRDEFMCFISNLRNYIEFMWEHNNSDWFMQIDESEMMYFEAMHRNISFLQNYFDTTHKLSPLDELIERSKEINGDKYPQTLVEGVLTDLFDDFKASALELVDIIEDLITEKESAYWMIEKTYIFNFFNNLDKDTLFS